MTCNGAGVGHNNLKYFFLFLFYGAGVGAMFLTLFSFCIYDLFKHVRVCCVSRVFVSRVVRCVTHACLFQSDKYTTEQLWINGVTVGTCRCCCTRAGGANRDRLYQG